MPRPTSSPWGATRHRWQHGRGRVATLRLAGLTAAGVAGLLGGHISFRLAGGANQAEPVPHLIEPGWHDLMPAAELAAARRSGR